MTQSTIGSPFELLSSALTSSSVDSHDPRSAGDANGAPALRPEQPRPRLSVVAIARNEEQDLPGFLDSFLPLADELILVDDGSTDRTCELAERAGTRVKLVRAPRAPGEGFCHQRNKGIALATGDWLLHADIDDRAPKSLAQEISRAVCAADVDAYEFHFVHFFLNRRLRFGGVQGWSKRWLVRRGMATFTGIVHEQLQLPRSARVKRLQGRMWHLGDDDFLERLRKNLTYSELEIERMIERGGARATLLGACWGGARAFLNTYLLQSGFRDGRAGLFWALYVWTGTVNRGLLAYDRLHPASRDELERRARDGEA